MHREVDAPSDLPARSQAVPQVRLDADARAPDAPAPPEHSDDTNAASALPVQDPGAPPTPALHDPGAPPARSVDDPLARPTLPLHDPGPPPARSVDDPLARPTLPLHEPGAPPARSVDDALARLTLPLHEPSAGPQESLADDLAGLGGWCEPAGSSPWRLFRFERRWLARVFDSLLPPAPESGLPGARDVPLGRFIDDLLAASPLVSVTGLRAALWLVWLAPLFLHRRLVAFGGLAPAGQNALLDRLRRSDVYLVRQAVTFLKILACLGLCGLGPVQRRLGIHPTDVTPPAWAKKKPQAGA
jgi:hypothetical protein